MSREVRARYRDPLEAVWRACAAAVGLRVVRSDEVFASSDGAGTLAIGSSETLDPDDSPAQMILHELCHALVEGEGSLGKRDFGLDNKGGGDPVREHACLVLQAELARSHGLRGFLAPTTEYRAFWDALPADPFAVADSAAAALAKDALERSFRPPFAPALQRALAATAAIVAAVRAGTPANPEEDGLLPLAHARG